MSLPTIEKSWQFNVNQVHGLTGTAYDDHRQNAYYFKESLKGFASNPWTVVSSSDGTSFGAGDLWTSPTVLNINPFAWIRLKQTGISANFEILFVCGHAFSNYPQYCSIYYSLLGFSTGGNVATRPTAADEQLVSYSGATTLFADGTAVTQQNIHHAMQSTDGEVTYYVICSGGAVTTFLAFAKPKVGIPGFTSPNVVMHYAAAYVFDTLGNAILRCLQGGVNYSIFLSSEAYGGNGGKVTVRGSNSLSSAFQVVPCGLYSTSLGRVGEMWDFWQTSAALITGDTFPSGGTKQLCVFGAGEIVLPWNGSTPLTA